MSIELILTNKDGNMKRLKEFHEQDIFFLVLSVFICGVVFCLGVIQNNFSSVTNYQPAKFTTEKGVKFDSQSMKDESGIFARLPLSFEENRGQSNENVRFLSRGQGYTLFLSSTEATLALKESDFSKRMTDSGAKSKDSVLRLKLRGANKSAKIVGENILPGRSNYIVGQNPQAWRTGIPNFSKVRVESVLPGVDQVYYGNQGRLEYDFILQPGASPDDIKVAVEGAEKIEVAESGELILTVNGKEVRQRQPVIYQETDGGKNFVAGKYVISNEGEFGFEVNDYDRSQPLVIDPVLVYSSYLGGSGADIGNDIAVDAEKNVYLTGLTWSSDFPAANAVEPVADPNRGDAFVTKINAAGNAVLYSTYFGGSVGDIGYGIDVDGANNVYVTGTTGGSISFNDFPVVNGFDGSYGGTDDAFLVKLDSTGNQILYSTYLGGANTEIGFEVKVVKSTGEAVVSGTTLSTTEFPTTPGAYQNACQGCVSSPFVTKFNVDGRTLAYSTLVGSATPNDMAIDAQANVYLTGETISTAFPVTPGAAQPTCRGCELGRSDAFILKLNNTGSAILYATYLGGSVDDVGRGIAVDAAGNAYVTGQTESTSLSIVPFPITSGALRPRTENRDAFVTKVNATGTAFEYSTFLGGDGIDEGFGVAVDNQGRAHVTGRADFLNFPLVNAFTPPVQSGIFLSSLNANGSALVFSSFLGGGSGRDVVTDNEGAVYLTGEVLYDRLLTANAVQPNPGGGEGVKDAFYAKVRIDATGRRIAAPDFDGDGRADISVYRNGSWYWLNSTGNSFGATQFGLSTDKITPADFDGDGRTDAAVFRDGIWYLQQSAAGFKAVNFGLAGDVPVPNDYDGDGRADIAVFRQGVWYFLHSSNNQFGAVQFGIASDKPVAADFDGDGKTDIAVFRAGAWYWLTSSDGRFHAAQWGLGDDLATPADFNGDRKTDLAVFRPSNGTWYFLNSSSNDFSAVQWGMSGDVPAAADFDGDGRADQAVFRNGVWWIRRSSGNYGVQQFGLGNDKPVPAAFLY